MAATFEESLMENMTAKREELRAALHGGRKMNPNEAHNFLRKYQNWKDLFEMLDYDEMPTAFIQSTQKREREARQQLESEAMCLLIDLLVEQAKGVLP